MLFQLSYAEYGVGVGRYRSFYLLLAKQILYHLSYDPVALFGGDYGYRSHYLSHAKRALYHMS